MNTSEFCERYSAERIGTGSVKWDGLTSKFGESDLIPMWIADMEFKAPDSVIDALNKKISHGVFGYSQAPKGYYEAVIAWQERRHGYKLSKDWIRFSTGAVVSLFQIVSAFTSSGDAVIMLTPVYYPFYNAVNDTGRELITCELVNKGGSYHIDFEDFEKKMEMHKPKLFILCSPHNPVGRVWTEEELEALLKICQENDCLVLADEIHQDLVIGERKHMPAACVANGAYANNLITIFAASKTFNLAGFFHSHMVITNADLRIIFDSYRKMNHQPDVNIMGMLATQAAYAGGEEWLEACLATIKENYLYAKAELEKALPKIVISPMEGSYLMWVDLRGYLGTDLDKIKDFVQGKCRLAVDYGEWFGKGNEGFIRMNLATDPRYIKYAVESIIKNTAMYRN